MDATKVNQIILIGNYPPDRQESMERFAQMLEAGFIQAGLTVELWRPLKFFGTIVSSTNSGIGKWLGYLDKWIVFPTVLRWRLFIKHTKYSKTHFHICDHSNAPYINHLPIRLTGITCHDILAIRGAFGYTDAYCPSSGLGKYLQKWILNNLTRAKLLAADTQNTLTQLNEITHEFSSEQRDWRMIHIGFNNDFKPIDKEIAINLLAHNGIIISKPFLLHVGSKLLRKNRKLLLDMVAALGDQWDGQICFAGQEVDKQLISHAQALGLEDRIVSVVKPSHDILVALYSTCDTFIFPSFSEGFGWPVIEAQACGAPVIASSVEPMPEVSGGAALHANPNSPEDFANAFLSLRNELLRNDLIQNGFENCKRFEPIHMINAYLSLHGINK